MRLIETYTDEEKSLLSEHGLTSDRYSQIADVFVLGFRCNKAQNEHLRLKEEECKELARDKKELVEALSALFNDYKQFADSGDAGNWRLEDEEVGKLALLALEKHQC